ncbi:MAG: tetratricopeptide repeat protein [Thermoplasmata archaeon]
MSCIVCGSSEENLCQNCDEKLSFFEFSGTYPGDSVVGRFNAVMRGEGNLELSRIEDYNRLFELLQVPQVPVRPGFVLTVGDIEVINSGVELLKKELKKGVGSLNTGFLLRLATLYCIKERKGEPAVILGKLALKSEPENIDANLVCGFGFIVWGEPTEASKFFDFVIEKQPENAIAWYGRALVMKASGRWGAAIQFLNEAIKIDENFYLAHLEKARILFNQQRFGEADKSADHAIRITPDIASAWALKAEILNAQGKWGGAYQCLNQAISLEPLNCEYLLQKAKLLIKHNRKAEAKEILDEIVNYEKSEEVNNLQRECE